MVIPDSLAPMIGSAAAVGTSILWTCSTLLFSTASRRLGATIVNVVRIWLALVLLIVAQRIFGGSWIPPGQSMQYTWLIVSGFLGVCIGDQALLTAYILIGPRLSAMVTTTAPLMAAAFGVAMLGEHISPIAGVGMVMTIGGVVWVVLERSPDSTQTTPSRRWLGIALATVSAACQAAGMLLSKKGIGHGWLPREQHLDPLAASTIRVAAAAVFVMPLLAYRAFRARPVANQHPTGTPSVSTAWTCAVIGAVVGPFMGMTLSLVAADLIPIGIAQTLCSLSPIFILPALAVLHRERVSVRAVLGAVLSVSGGALLFLSRA